LINDEEGRSAGGSRPSRARARLSIAVVAALATVVCAAPAADAASNGVIAFEVTSGKQPSLATITVDGSGNYAVPGAPAGSANVAWSADGTQLAFSSPVAGVNQVFTMSANGTRLRQISHDPVGAIDPTWSPDGTHLAFASYANTLPAIVVADLGNGEVRPLTSDSGFEDRQPRWSPDGREIAFASNRTGSLEVTTIAPSGSGETTITSQPGDNSDPSWSPDGTEIAYTNNEDGVRHLEAVASDGSTSRQLALGDGDDAFPAWSPDGTKIAFSRNGDLYVIPSSGETTSSPATFVTTGATDPAWAPAPSTIVAPVKGTSTATQPKLGTQTVTNVQPVIVGTTVNSTTGTSLVVFKPLTTPLTAPPVTTTVQGGKYTLVAKTPDRLTLKLAAPVCARHTQARTASPNREVARTRVHVKGGHVKVLAGHVLAGSQDPPDFTLANACNGTRVTVTTGVVQVTVTGVRRRVHGRGGHPHVIVTTQVVRLHGGQGVFVTRGRFAAATVRG
jgi:TolB protein